MQHPPWAMLLPCVRHAQITTFATCLAQASSKDANYAAAMVALEQAEREVASCKISFPPHITVVDRKMRVVAGRPRSRPGPPLCLSTGWPARPPMSA